MKATDLEITFEEEKGVVKRKREDRKALGKVILELRKPERPHFR